MHMKLTENCDIIYSSVEIIIKTSKQTWKYQKLANTAFKNIVMPSISCYLKRYRYWKLSDICAKCEQNNARIVVTNLMSNYCSRKSTAMLFLVCSSFIQILYVYTIFGRYIIFPSSNPSCAIVQATPYIGHNTWILPGDSGARLWFVGFYWSVPLCEMFLALNKLVHQLPTTTFLCWLRSVYFPKIMKIVSHFSFLKKCEQYSCRNVTFFSAHI
jgi:hypothetical protein